MHLRSFASMLCALAIGCGGDEPASGAPGDASASSTGTSRNAADDVAEVSEYRLTMDRMDRFYAAQLAIARRVKDLSPEERAPLEQMESSADASLDDMVRRMESHPAMRDGLREAGMSAREFATLTMAMIQTGMAASVLQMRPDDNQDSLAREMKASMENIRFLQENEAELTRKQQQFEAEMREIGIPPSSFQEKRSPLCWCGRITSSKTGSSSHARAVRLPA